MLTGLYRLLPADQVSQFKDLLAHSERSAGSLLNTQFLTAKCTATAG